MLDADDWVLEVYKHNNKSKSVHRFNHQSKDNILNTTNTFIAIIYLFFLIK